MSYTSIRHSRNVLGLTPLFGLAMIYSLMATQQAVAQARRKNTPLPIFRPGNNGRQAGNSQNRPLPIFRGGNNGGQGGNSQNRPLPIFRGGNNGGQPGAGQGSGGFGGTGQGTGQGGGFGGTGQGTGQGGGFGGTRGGNPNLGRGRNVTPNQGGNLKQLNR